MVRFGRAPSVVERSEGIVISDKCFCLYAQMAREKLSKAKERKSCCG